MELDYEQKRQIKELADHMESSLDEEDKVHMIRQINDWSVGAWSVCCRLHLWGECHRFAEVAVHAKHRLEELDDAEQDTDTLVGR